MADRYEPGPTGDYGADGIPRDGMAERYATAMWRDDPAAFWLHPEGPLSDTTPDEYFVPRPEPTEGEWIHQRYAGMGMLNSYSQASAMAQYQRHLLSQSAGLGNAYSNHPGSGALQLLGLLRQPTLDDPAWFGIVMGLESAP